MSRTKANLDMAREISTWRERSRHGKRDLSMSKVDQGEAKVDLDGSREVTIGSIQIEFKRGRTTI